jgi:hypothetical protein
VVEHISDAIDYLKTQIKLNSLSENEILLLNSFVYFDYYIISFDNISKDSIRFLSSDKIDTLKTGMRSIAKIYNILGNEIAIGKILDDILSGNIKDFNYVRDVLKLFYKNYLTETEKTHIIHLLNISVNGILIKSVSIGDVSENLSNLLYFFNASYYLTDGMFRYENIIADYISNTNDYNSDKMFYNSLVKEILKMKNRRDGVSLIALNNISDVLASKLKDFNRSMANLAFK